MTDDRDHRDARDDAHGDVPDGDAVDARADGTGQDADEPEFGSSDWLLQQLTGGRRAAEGDEGERSAGSAEGAEGAGFEDLLRAPDEPTAAEPEPVATGFSWNLVSKSHDTDTTGTDAADAADDPAAEAPGFADGEFVDSGSDLNAYKKVENQAGCCSPAMESSCCSPASPSPTLHEELNDLLDTYDVNLAAASVKIYAIKPGAATAPCCKPGCCS